MKVLIFSMALIGASFGTVKLALPPLCYTQWFDRDNPSGGDYETRALLTMQYPGKICPKPKTIQAATLTGVPAESIGQVFSSYDVSTGFICLNPQPNGECCLDYKVRFGCPCPWPVIIKPNVSLAEIAEDAAINRTIISQTETPADN
ncbi:cartilage intermediate layer protein 1-like [Colossoma macropomum]|uniref:cartilage intermediate layer protein 1-like n=1 Tax=Colossoma macropomum TaxID=42526 RepID=UPI00186485F1|nr:cartilage intermediate layer protein 1-like [Colossoma macropomum]